MAATSTQALIDTLTGLGNLDKGFEEAPSRTEDPTYPPQPGVLSVGDWVYATTAGHVVTQALRETIEAQIKAGRFMTLPIYDVAMGSGANRTFHVTRLGTFVLLGGRLSGGHYYTLDLVFLGGAPMSCDGPPPREAPPPDAGAAAP